MSVPSLVSVIATLVLALLACGSLSAQSFPSRNLRFIGIATAGATSDLIGRTVADPLARRLGHSVVIEQRGGAGGFGGWSCHGIIIGRARDWRSGNW